MTKSNSMKLFDVKLDAVRARREAFEASRPDHRIPADTRRYLLEGRNGLLYLPSHGPHGGLLMRVAQATGVSRQHVQKTLFPTDPSDLFGSGVTSNHIWAETASQVYNHRLYPQLKMAFDALEADGKVILRASAPIANFFLNRSVKIGLQAVVVEMEPTSPITYDIRLLNAAIG